MKKNHSLILAFIAGLGLCANATQRTVGQFSFDDAYTLTNAMCILDDTTVWYQIAVDNPSSAFIRWGAAGEIETKNGNSSSILVRSKGAAKGRVYYYYNQGDCGSQAYGLDVYKHFNPNASPYNLVIEGPDCVGDSETVVFSVEPILTKNINSGLGIDTYSWRFISQAGTTYVDSVSYKSGDGSAITFTTGRLIGNEQIAVQVGRANEQYIIVKDLGRAAPRPDVPTDTCVASGDKQTIRMEVRNSSDSLEYTWTAPTTWDISRVSKNGSIVEIEANGKDGGTVTVMAAFKSNSGTCGSASRSVININRSWANGIDITPKTTCSFNGDSALTFVLDKDKLPSTDNITWDIPTTWSQKENKGLHSATLEAFPLSSTNYIDTLRVWTDNCGGNEQFAYVHIAPAKAAPVSNQGCLIAGQTDTFSIATMSVGPQAMSYTWFVDGNVVRQSGTDTLIQTLTANNHYVAVRANGKNGCNADSVQIALSFKPMAPTGIVAAHCITVGTEDTVTLKLTGVTQNQDYIWVLPNGVDSILAGAHDTTLLVRTSGNQGSYTIWAYGKGSGSCKLSDSISYSFNIGTADYDLKIYDIGGAYNVKCSPSMSDVAIDYRWFIDGSPYAFGTGQPQTFVFGSFQNVQCIITLDNNCRQSVIKNFYVEPNNASKKRNSNIIYENKQVKIMPNPTQSEVKIKLTENNNSAEVSIYNMYGQILQKFVMYSEEAVITVADLPDGTYPIIVNNGGETFADVLIIKH